jgi:formylglycine-generating enzyme
VVKDGHEGRAPVMSYRTNSIGIYDLGGNVMEWCQDRLSPGRNDRVLRGASFSTYPYDRDVLKSSHRFSMPPGYRKADVGFRCVIEVPARGSSQLD